MKKLISLLIIIFTLPQLASCNTIYSNYREIEQLLLIQTLGLDLEKGSITASIAAASDAAGSGPRHMSASGGTIISAIDRAYDRSYEEEIFFSHINHVLIGEASAQEGLMPFLDFLCQSPEIQIDIPLYIVKGNTAYQAVTGTGSDSLGISRVMQAVEESFASPSNSKVFTVTDILSSLERNGSALVCAVECITSSEGSEPVGQDQQQEQPQQQTSPESSPQPESSTEEQIVTPAGYAVIRDGKLCKFLDIEAALPIGLIGGSVPITPLVLRDINGQPCTLEIDSGSTKLEGIWAGPGQLKGLQLQTKVHSSLQESPHLEVNSERYIDHLTAQLESEISQQLLTLLKTSMELRSDFMGMGKRLERSSPENYRLLTQSFPQLLPELELQVSVSAQLNHTNNMKET